MLPKIADVLEVPLGYLAGEGINSNSMRRKKKTLYDLIDTYIRDAKARKAYS
ncbi:hypothetical protein ACFQ21_19185 [Ohtaekwangia kribbensis]|jgi:hypothetical protein|uniref:XRE family transcriptional regulator n=1 Tax=Ohtaekwangia kribbensis TaxID=688913 RepID=A0ABW3K8D8_9BACT